MSPNFVRFDAPRGLECVTTSVDGCQSTSLPPVSSLIRGRLGVGRLLRGGRGGAAGEGPNPPSPFPLREGGELSKERWPGPCTGRGGLRGASSLNVPPLPASGRGTGG